MGQFSPIAATLFLSFLFQLISFLNLEFLSYVKGRPHCSISILTETAQKLRDKFLWSDDKITAALKHISKVATVVKPRFKLNILTDDPDNRVLECAVEVNADLIVTGEKHLLSLKEYEGIGITRVSGLLYTLSK